MNVGNKNIPFVSSAKVCEEQKINIWCHSMLNECAYDKANDVEIKTWGGVTSRRLFTIISMVLLPRS